MPKIIIKIPHIKANITTGKLVEYIAKRDGVDKTVNQQVVIAQPTKKQMEYISELLKLCPEAKESYEYKDYIENPTERNASAFISVIAEQNPQLYPDRKTYISYIATRPNVEKFGEHGLFGAEDLIELSDVKAEVMKHSGVIWTPIISLKREDAERLGYDNAESWQDLIRAKQMDMAEVFGIPFNDFKWYAAFHNEGHHPHLHMVVYSTDSTNGFIQEKDIEKIKSMLVNEIFKNEMYELYNSKTQARERIAEESKRRIVELVEKVKNKECSDFEVCDMIAAFANKLRAVNGKKKYGYLPLRMKQEVDEIVKVLANDEDVSKLYNEWCNIQKDIAGVYKDSEIELPPLWKNKEFKKIKNAVIDEAVKLYNDRIVLPEHKQDEFTDDEEIELPFTSMPEDEETFSKRYIEEKTQINFDLQNASVYMATFNLFCKIATVINDDAKEKIDGYRKTIVDSKERTELIKKKRSLGIKMG